MNIVTICASIDELKHDIRNDGMEPRAFMMQAHTIVFDQRHFGGGLYLWKNRHTGQTGYITEEEYTKLTGDVLPPLEDWA